MASSSMLTSLLQSLPSSRFSFRVNSGIGAYNPLLGLLETKLANQLELLKLQDIDQESFLSAKWLTKAMSTVLSTISTMKTFLPDLQHTLSESANFPKWLDECLDDNIRLLDACLFIQETLACITEQHSYVKSVLAFMPSDKPPSKATLRRAAHAISQYGKLTEKKSMDVSSKRSKLETCGSVLRRMGEKLYNLDDAYKGNGWGVMYVAHMITIFVCGVLMTALSVGARRTSVTTISISTQSNWSLALSGIQQRIKEQVEKKRVKTQRMPYLEELENVEASLNTLEYVITQADQFPISLEIEELIKQAIGELGGSCKEFGDGVAQLEQDIYDLYQALISCRMMLLDIYPKTCTIPRL